MIKKERAEEQKYRQSQFTSTSQGRCGGTAGEEPGLCGAELKLTDSFMQGKMNHHSDFTLASQIQTARPHLKYRVERFLTGMKRKAGDASETNSVDCEQKSKIPPNAQWTQCYMKLD